DGRRHRARQALIVSRAVRPSPEPRDGDRAPRGATALSPLRGNTALPRLVLDGARVRALRAGLRAGPGLLRRGHLHQLRRELGDRGRRLVRAVGLVRPAQPVAVHDLGAVPHRLPAVVLPLQPEPLAGDRVLRESGAMSGDADRAKHGGCGRVSHLTHIRGGIGGDVSSPPIFTVSRVNRPGCGRIVGRDANGGAIGGGVSPHPMFITKALRQYSAPLCAALVLALATQAAAYEEIAVKDGGALSGRVKFAGPPPTLEPLPVNKNRDVCGDRKPSEALVIGTDGGVRGAVIFLEGVTKGKKPTGEVLLDNHKCLFVGHVTAT